MPDDIAPASLPGAPSLPPLPFWVEGGDGTRGIDILGLRGPVQAIGNQLMDGVTTITKRLRFLSLLAWTIDRYRASGLPDSSAAFDGFAGRVETAAVAGHVLNGPVPSALNGSSEIRAALAGDADVPLSPVVDALALGQFRGAASMLKLISVEEERTAITRERGVPLARAFEAAVGATGFARRLSADPSLHAASREELREFAAAARMDAVPAGPEARAILDAIIPDAPIDDEESRESERIRTYALLLWLARGADRPIAEKDLFEAAERVPDGLPAPLRPALDGWLEYRVRDAVALAGEAAFKSVLLALAARAKADGRRCDAEAVLAALAGDGARHEAALGDAGILDAGILDAGGWTAAMTVAELRRLIRARAGAIVPGPGPRRWSGDLSEGRLMKAAKANLKNATALLPAAFIMADERLPADPEGAGIRFLHRHSPGHLCLAGAIRPMLAELERDGATVAEAAGRLAQRMVDQHLRIAWSRLRTGGRDIAVMLTDGPDWIPRPLTIQPQRTGSRIPEAIGWLSQAGALKPGGGLTALGEAELARALAVLRRADAAPAAGGAA